MTATPTPTSLQTATDTLKRAVAQQEATKAALASGTGTAVPNPTGTPGAGRSVGGTFGTPTAGPAVAQASAGGSALSQSDPATATGQGSGAAGFVFPEPGAGIVRPGDVASATGLAIGGTGVPATGNRSAPTGSAQSASNANQGSGSTGSGAGAGTNGAQGPGQTRLSRADAESRYKDLLDLQNRLRAIQQSIGRVQGDNGSPYILSLTQALDATLAQIDQHLSTLERGIDPGGPPTAQLPTSLLGAIQPTLAAYGLIYDPATQGFRKPAPGEEAAAARQTIKDAVKAGFLITEGDGEGMTFRPGTNSEIANKAASNASLEQLANQIVRYEKDGMVNASSFTNTAQSLDPVLQEELNARIKELGGKTKIAPPATYTGTPIQQTGQAVLDQQKAWTKELGATEVRNQQTDARNELRDSKAAMVAGGAGRSTPGRAITPDELAGGFDTAYGNIYGELGNDDDKVSAYEDWLGTLGHIQISPNNAQAIVYDDEGNPSPAIAPELFLADREKRKNKQGQL